jgi:hypothetical protein
VVPAETSEKEPGEEPEAGEARAGGEAAAVTGPCKEDSKSLISVVVVMTKNFLS